MKKLVPAIFLSATILTLTFTSCDADMRSQVANLMDNASGNVYLDNGLIEANTEDVEAVSDTVSTIGNETLSGTLDFGGVEITVDPREDEPLAPLDEEEQAQLEEDLSATFNSPSQTAQLQTEMAGGASDEQKDAAGASLYLINYVLGQISGGLEADDPLKDVLESIDLTPAGEMTKGDVLLVQMMTNLVSNIGDVLAGDDDPSDEELLSLADDALFAA